MLKPKETDALSDIEAIRKVKRLKDLAMIRVASQSGMPYFPLITLSCIMVEIFTGEVIFDANF